MDAAEVIAKNKNVYADLSGFVAGADDFDYSETFELEQEFDKIYFSYSISMIPAWRDAIANALKNLRKGGSMFIVDFYDQRDLPGWFSGVLKKWLRKFQVKYPQDLIPHLDEFQEEGTGKHSFHSVYKSYAFISRFKKV